MSAQNLFDYDELAADPLDLSDSRQNRREDIHDETRSRDSEPEEETDYSRDGSTTLRDTPTVYDEDERPLPEPVRQTIIDAHQSVWHEFYHWEYDFCAKKIASFAAEPQEEDPYADFFAAYDRAVEDGMNVDSDIPQAGASDDDDAPRFTIYEFETKTTSIVATRTITVPPLPPYPKYEGCTPSDCNIWLNGPKPILNFFKYDGEIDKHGLEFDSRKYMSEFDHITWRDDRIDPDHLVIASKTVQILTEWQRIKPDSLVGNKIRVTYEDIDRLGIFSAFGKDVEDLEFEMRQRDMLLWSGSGFEGEDQRYLKERVQENLKKQDRFSVVATSFCPNLSCIRAACFVHPYEDGWLPTKESVPRLKNEVLVAKVKEPCGAGCFLNHPGPYNEDDMPSGVEPSELDVLEHLLKTEPDGTPCELAACLRGIQCYQVFAKRKEPPEDNYSASWDDPTTRQGLKRFHDTGAQGGWGDFMPQVRCEHNGPCDKETACKCFQSGSHCQRNCWCDMKCKLRYKGCRSKDCQCTELKVGGKRRATYSNSDNYHSCRCETIDWECNPEVCQPPPAAKSRKGKAVRKGKFRLHTCRNYMLQNQLPAAIEVKTGSFGLGAYAAQDISKGSYIGEYIAESMHPSRLEPRGHDYKFIGLNYSFTLNGDQLLDAQNVGNEIRFLNHAPAEVENVEVKLRLVNGDNRVGLYALRKIKRGEELLWNYGDQYWRSDTPGKEV